MNNKKNKTLLSVITLALLVILIFTLTKNNAFSDVTALPLKAVEGGKESLADKEPSADKSIARISKERKTPGTVNKSAAITQKNCPVLPGGLELDEQWKLDKKQEFKDELINGILSNGMVS